MCALYRRTTSALEPCGRVLDGRSTRGLLLPVQRSIAKAKPGTASPTRCGTEKSACGAELPCRRWRTSSSTSARAVRMSARRLRGSPARLLGRVRVPRDPCRPHPAQTDRFSQQGRRRTRALPGNISRTRTPLYDAWKLLPEIAADDCVDTMERRSRGRRECWGNFRGAGTLR